MPRGLVLAGWHGARERETTMSETAVKMQPFACVRYPTIDDDCKDAAERELRSAAAEHHGANWPAVEKFYEVRHFELGEGNHRSGLFSAAAWVVLVDP